LVYRLLVASPKGGGAKTTLCRNLAVSAVRDRLKVVTADLDPQGTLTTWSRRRPLDLPKIPHYRMRLEEAPDRLADGEISAYGAVLIDTAPSIEAYPSEFARLLSVADLVIVPVRTTFDDAESAAPFLDHLHRRGHRSVVVLTCLKPRVNITEVKAYLLEHAEICPIEMADRADYPRAGAKGLGLPDIPGHVGAAEVNGIWRFVRSKAWRKTHAAD
jgi:chromosome partitioning protein